MRPRTAVVLLSLVISAVIGWCALAWNTGRVNRDIRGTWYFATRSGTVGSIVVGASKCSHGPFDYECYSDGDVLVLRARKDDSSPIAFLGEENNEYREVRLIVLSSEMLVSYRFFGELTRTRPQVTPLGPLDGAWTIDSRWIKGLDRRERARLRPFLEGVEPIFTIQQEGCLIKGLPVQCGFSDTSIAFKMREDSYVASALRAFGFPRRLPKEWDDGTNWIIPFNRRIDGNRDELIAEHSDGSLPNLVLVRVGPSRSLKNVPSPSRE